MKADRKITYHLWCRVFFSTEGDHTRALGDRQHVKGHWATGCVIYQNGSNILRKTKWDEHQVQRKMHHELMRIQSHHQQQHLLQRVLQRDPFRTRQAENAIHQDIFRKIRIVKCACAQKSQERVANEISNVEQTEFLKAEIIWGYICCGSDTTQYREFAITTQIFCGCPRFGRTMDTELTMQKNKNARETVKSLCRFSPPEADLRSIYTDNLLEFINACEDLNWNHDRSTPHRSETNGIVERAEHQVREVTASPLVQSGLHKSFFG